MIFTNIAIVLLAVASELNYTTASQLRTLKGNKKEKSTKGTKSPKKSSKSEKATKCDGGFPIKKPPSGINTCAGKDLGLPDIDCYVNAMSGPVFNNTYIIGKSEQSGVNVTKGYNGDFNAISVPLTNPFWVEGMCAVNVHFHLGTEHLSAGEYDENGNGPTGEAHSRILAENVQSGYKCHHYDADDSKFTKTYEWKHCKDVHVGETYEVHWPHSNAGACGTLNQFQVPFADGVFCNYIDLDSLKAGVQAQVFTIVNDEDYYYPDLMHGMIVDGDKGKDKAIYTGSTTGEKRSNEVCSQVSGITWQVDRKCHMISASTFDKMCADMMSQRDDMSTALHPHGARELVDDALAADNHAQP